MFFGRDLHKQAAQVAVRNDDGELIEETRVDNEDLEPLAERYAGREALLEATTNYFYIYDWSRLSELTPPPSRDLGDSSRHTGARVRGTAHTRYGHGVGRRSAV